MQNQGRLMLPNGLFKAFVLGAVQGAAEWLPISSTGHLRIVEKALGVEAPLLLDVSLHAATLAVTLLYFRSDIKRLLSALLTLDFKSEYGKLIPLIVVGTVPTTIIGLASVVFLQDLFYDFSAIAMFFLACGIVLYASRVGGEHGSSISYFEAFIIGAVQGLAVLPGLSRSGLTIATALLLGISREKAFKFSFLLSIPAVIGAFGLTLYTGYGELASSVLSLPDLLAGAAAAFVMGFFAIRILWKTVYRRLFHYFAFYCWILGAFLLASSACGFF
ncbi:MAG: undecaprenyl-diphosphate phosphatase [Candidatus Bathyarchaeia archaeon]